MKAITFATCVFFVFLMGASEAFSEEKDIKTQHREDIQRTARITGDPIDVVRKFYNMCDSGHTPEMAQCVEYLWKSEDGELNNLYKQVRGRVKAKFGTGSVAEKSLIQAQRAWVTFRNATCRLETEGYSHGVPIETENLACLTEETKKRNHDLSDYLERVHE
jgi:uncharacterized protein YecT (DUF1311 family)